MVLMDLDIRLVCLSLHGFCFFLLVRPPSISTLFPYTTLFRSNSWNEMPAIGEQLELPWTFPAGFTVARGLLRPGRAYADAVKLFEPYDRIRDPQPEVRLDLLRLLAEVMRRHMEALIVVNNRREANAPGPIRALGEVMD